MRTTLRCILCIAMIVTTITSLTAQQSKIDSLTTLLETHAQPDTNRVRVMNQLAHATGSGNPSAAKQLGEEALALAIKIGDVKGQSKCHFSLMYIYIYLGEKDMAMESAEACKALSLEVNFTQQVVDAHYILGHLNVSKGDMVEGKSHYQSCIDISQTIDYKVGLSKGAKGLGDILYNEGNLEQARMKYQLCLEASQDIDYKSVIIIAHNNLGRVAKKRGDLDLALKYYLEALTIAEEYGTKSNYTSILNNIGSLYKQMKNFPKALEYLNQAMEIRKELKNKIGIAFSLGDIASVYRLQNKIPEALELYNQKLIINTELGHKKELAHTNQSMAVLYNNIEEYRKALIYAKRSLALREEIGYKSGISYPIKSIGNSYIGLKLYEVALPYLMKSLKIAQETKNLDELYAAYNALSQCYDEMGNYRLAFDSHKLLKSISDSLFVQDQNKQIANMQTRYETEKKEKQIAQQENEIMELETNNAQIARQRNYIFGGASLIGLLAFLGYRVNKIRKDRNDKIEFAEALLYTQEEERKRIACDLHDSIGQSLLLVKKELMGNNAVTHQNQALISNTLEEVRAISRDLHPFQLDKFGFTATIKDVLEKVQKSSGLFISHDITDIDDELSDKEEIHLYRVIQESFNNIIKHAKATAANLVIAKKDDGLEVVVRDNGVGYDHEYALVKSKSLGLRTMHERISAIGGKLNVRGGDPQGTIIEIKIPNKV